MFTALIVLLFTVLQTGGERKAEQSLTDFVAEVEAGNVLYAEIDAPEITYRLKDDDVTYKTEMEQGDTFRQVLQDAGIKPEDFPPYEIKVASRWGNVLNLFLSFLPLILILWFIYFLVRRASRPPTPAPTKPPSDPVCGKSVEPSASSGSSTFQDVTYYFCSPEHKSDFDADPVRYLLKK